MKIYLFGVPISITSKTQALAVIGEWVLARRARIPKIIVTPNPEIIVAAQSDPEFLKALQSADLAIPDGVGVVWALRILNTEYRMGNSVFPFSRLSGLDLMESLILQPQKVAPYELHPLKVMLLGGRPGVAQKAAEKLTNRFGSRFSVVGFQSQVNRLSVSRFETEKLKTGKPVTENRKQKTDNWLQIKALSGFQDIANISKSENDRFIAQINSFSPDLLFVAFGHPRQEKWLAANRRKLTAGVAMAVGGAFDQIANQSLRPPVYINSIGMGWLYRLARQPWRVRRQLALIKFVWMVINKKLQFSSSKLQ